MLDSAATQVRRASHTTRTGHRASARPRWLLLIHEIPPKPDYFRVKVRRRLHRVGAVALKNSVYVLPRGDETLEDFQWLLREIVADGGDATLCEAAFVEGIDDAELEAIFRAARDADYTEIATAARAIAGAARTARDGSQHAGRPHADLARLRRRLDDVVAIDYFKALGREEALDALAAAEARLCPPEVPATGTTRKAAHHFSPGRVWVTREGVHVDRIASAWLIRRFIDPKARFKFVTSRKYRPAANEVRFDMFEAEYTHEGDLCTFETLLDHFGLQERGLRAIGELVHDIDFKEARFARPETAGFAALIDGIALTHEDDPARLERGATALDDLYTVFRRRPGTRR